MYKDLADAIESLKEKGYEYTFELVNGAITCSEIDRDFTPEELTIIETQKFDPGTDPGSESTVYAIQSEDGVKGKLVTSFGKYVDQENAKLIDRLLENQG